MTVTGVEIGPDYCVLVRARRRESAIEVTAIRIFDSLEWSTDFEVQAGQLRDARRELSLPRKAAVVVWTAGRQRSQSPEALLGAAGFTVERILSPIDALGIMSRSRANASGEGATAWISMNHHGVAFAVVRDGNVLESREFAWRIKASEQRVQAHVLRRYLYVAQLVPEMRSVKDSIEKRYRTSIDVAITSGNVPDLRSLTMPLIEALDIEFETLDSPTGLKASGPVGAAVGQTASSLRLAAAAACAIDRSGNSHSGRWLGAAAVLMLAAGVVAWGFTMRAGSADRTSEAAPTAPVPPPVVAQSDAPAPQTAPQPDSTGAPVATSPPPEAVPAPRPSIGTRGVDRSDGGAVPRSPDLPAVGGVLISADRKLAVVEGAVVGIGDKVGPHTVVGIEPNAVIFRDAAGRETRVPIRPRSGT